MNLTQLTIGERVGRGGMGAVHRATWKSPAGGVPVAVKFIVGAGELGADAALLREARSAARLSHPNIVTLLDAGRVTEPDGPGPLGAPYLVMEWVDGQTLSDRRPESWGETQATLRELLLGLAHAHGWGVLHRDLKPNNVMRTPDNVVRLMDFGVGRVLDDFADPETGRRTRLVTGTPRYMAPEQVMGQWRDEGPWTDIYGLGALAWELVTGSPPFNGDQQEILFAQVRDRPPRLASQFDLPPGVRNWLYTMLEKRPDDRFRSAAEALAALEHMDAGERTSRYPVVTPGKANSNVATKLSVPQRHPTDDRPVSTELRAAGAGLFGMREPPIVGRASEKEQLWNALRRVSRLERAEAVILAGPSGVGKTSLARWLERRALEGGYAAVLRCEHEEGVAGDAALSGAVMRWFRLFGLPTSEGLERLAAGLAGLGFDGARELALDVWARRYPAESDRRGLHDLNVWHRFLLDFAQRTGHGAPVIWILDDVHRSPASQAFLRDAGEAEFALMLVATTQDAGGVGVRRSVELSLGPQSDTSLRELVHSMLPLEPELTDTLIRLSEGSALFATQLLGEWVSRGVLEPGPLGYKTSVDVTTFVPATVRELWNKRTDTALEGQAPHVREALVLLAVMGERVPLAQWQRACLTLDIRDCEAILEALAPHGLVELRGETIHFAHGLLRASIIAASAGLGAHHAAAADALIAAAPTARAAERAARHLWAAGQRLPALDQMYRAISAYDDAEEGDAVIFLVPLLAEWAAEAGEGLNICLADSLLRLHRTLIARGAPAEASTQLDACAAIVYAAVSAEDLIASPDGLRNRVAAGIELRRSGLIRLDEPAAALRHLETARRLAEGGLDANLIMEVATCHAHVLSEQGRFEEARRVLDGALRGVRDRPVDRRTAISADLQMSAVFEFVGDYDQALEALLRVEASASAIGARGMLAFARSRRGDYLAFAGRFDEAHAAALEAAAIYGSLGNWKERLCKMNLLLYEIFAGRAGANRERAHHVVADCDDGAMGPFRPLTLLAAAVCECASSDEARASRLFESMTAMAEPPAPREIAMLAVELAEHASGSLRRDAMAFATERRDALPRLYSARLEAMA